MAGALELELPARLSYLTGYIAMAFGDGCKRKLVTHIATLSKQ
jgi:hypothetical protein